MIVIDEAKILKRTKKRHLADVTVANLGQYGASALDPAAMAAMHNLVELNLSRNNLEKFACPLRKLQKLDLSHNRLTSVSSLKQLTSLRELSLAGNESLPAFTRLSVVLALPGLLILDGQATTDDRQEAKLLNRQARELVNARWESDWQKKLFGLAAGEALQLLDKFLQPCLRPSSVQNDFFNKQLVVYGRHCIKTGSVHKIPRVSSSARESIGWLGNTSSSPLSPAGSLSSRPASLPPTPAPQSASIFLAKKSPPAKPDRVTSAAKRKFSETKITSKKQEVLEQPGTLLNPMAFMKAHVVGEEEELSEVWACAAAPEFTNMENIIGTVGGDAICFIDCSLQRVVAKYSHEGECFYCLDWAVFDCPKPISLVAAAGLQGDLKVIDYSQKACVLQIGGSTKAVNAVRFSRHNAQLLLSGGDDEVLRLHKINVEVSPVSTLFSSVLLQQVAVGGSIMSLRDYNSCVFFAGLSNGVLCCWNTAAKRTQKRSLQTKKVHKGIIDSILVMPDEEKLVTRASGEAQLLLTGWTMAAGFADSTSMSWPAVEEYFVKVNLLSIGVNHFFIGGDHKGNIYKLSVSNFDEYREPTGSAALSVPVREVVITRSGDYLVAAYDQNCIGIFGVLP